MKYNRGLICLVFVLMLGLCAFTVSGAGSLAITYVSDPIVPGSLAQITFTAPEQMTVDAMIVNVSGGIMAVIAKGYDVPAGETTIGWNGIYFGEAVEPGRYFIEVTGNGLSASMPVVITDASVMFTQVMFSSHDIKPDSYLNIIVASNTEATLVFSVIAEGVESEIERRPVSSEGISLDWNGKVEGEPLTAGAYTVSLALEDPLTGEVFAVEHHLVSILPTDIVPSSDSGSGSAEKYIEATDDTQSASSVFYTPSHMTEANCSHPNCYWSTPMDITNEAVVWATLMAPMTYVKGAQRSQIRLLSEPNEKSTQVGDVTCASQSVHVLETLDNGWSYVETYSSSFHDSKIKAWNKLVRGYVKTNLLEEKKPGNTEFGIVVDKLTQRLYIFRNGKNIAELLCSTGIGTKKQPYNETRSGEFFLLSATGEFVSDNLICPYAIRFNWGDLLHEVPHINNADGTPNFRVTEPKLGQRASHGCIRVQRLRNADGINMKWIWDNMRSNISVKTVKLFIWEDFPGRQIPLPDPNYVLYYNPDGGTNYHLRERCPVVKDKFLPLKPFNYGDFGSPPFSKLTACPNCCPIRKPDEILKINQANQVNDGV